MRTNLFEFLTDREILTQEELNECLEMQKNSQKTLVAAVKQKAFASEEDLLESMAVYLDLPFLKSLDDFEEAPQEFIDKIPGSFARIHNLAPLQQKNGVFEVATADPLDLHPIDELSSKLGSPVELICVPRHEIAGYLNRIYQHQEKSYGEFMDEDTLLDEDVDIDQQLRELEDKIDVVDVYQQPPIIRLVNRILYDGLKARASDIHLQPMEERLQVRYRIDGILYDMQEIHKKLQEAVVSRIKIMGKMDIAERRLPQDGRTTVKKGEGEIDVRISSVPTSQGERIVLRLLDKTQKLFHLNEVGLSPEQEQKLRKLVNLPNGIIFVTGPTGSGKTTTLYASLLELDAKAKNIITIEDPIEYGLPSISQIQVSSKKGLTFAAGLRSLLRQDPDVMMVGEVRDEETARIAIQSALTGHLVLSTLHTNDSVGALSRMMDIGVEPYLVASSIVAVVAQRLVRQICEHCKEEYVPTEEELRDINIKPEQIIHGVLTRGRGCSHCMGTGYFSRTAIYETLMLDDHIRSEVMERASAAQIKDYAIKKKGLKTLRMDGAQKVLDGLTTIKEVLRVTVMDVM